MQSNFQEKISPLLILLVILHIHNFSVVSIGIFTFWNDPQI